MRDWIPTRDFKPTTTVGLSSTTRRICKRRLCGWLMRARTLSDLSKGVRWASLMVLSIIPTTSSLRLAVELLTITTLNQPLATNNPTMQGRFSFQTQTKAIAFHTSSCSHSNPRLIGGAHQRRIMMIVSQCRRVIQADVTQRSSSHRVIQFLSSLWASKTHHDKARQANSRVLAKANTLSTSYWVQND